MLVVVAYDIIDDERRLRVSRILENYGSRVQKSVFECYLTPHQEEELEKRITDHVLPAEDNVRYYRVCRDCLAQSRVTGPVPLTTDPDYYLV